MKAITWSVTGTSSNCTFDTTYPGASGDGVAAEWTAFSPGANGTRNFFGKKVWANPGSYSFSCTIGAASDSAILNVADCTAPTVWSAATHTCVIPACTDGSEWCDSWPSCSFRAGTFGIPASNTVGTACFIENSCTGNYYTRGCSAPAAAPTLSLSAAPNPITVGNSTTLTWTTSGATSCWASTAGWSGWKAAGGSSESVSPVVTTTYTMECWNAANVSTGQQSFKVTVNPVAVPAAVHICPSSATIAPASPFQLKAFYTAAGTGFTNCVAPNGSNVTANAGTNWTSLQPAKVSVNNAGSKGLVTGVSGSTTINGTYSGITGTATVTVTCSPTNSCADIALQTKANAICTSDSFTIDDGCGVSITCSGNRTCDYNWKEVAP